MLRLGRLAGGLLCLVIWALAACPALAAPGDLDPSFGNGGKAKVDLGGDEGGIDLVLQPDGRVIVVGSIRSPSDSNAAIMRLTAQGALDTSFGQGSGWSQLDFGSNTYATGVGLQNDGSIDVAGSTFASGQQQFFVAQLLNPQGIQDPAFGGGNGVTLKYSSLSASGSNDFVSALAVQPDGKIVVAGHEDYANLAMGSDFAVARVTNPVGDLDPVFNMGNGRLINFGNNSNDNGGDVALQPDGRILVAGGATTGPTGDFGVARLLSDGTLDSSFGAGTGKVSVDFGNGYEYAYGVAVQTDGKIILVGQIPGTHNDADFGIARLLSNGSLDNSFSGDGKAAVDVSLHEYATNVKVQSDGKLLLAGIADAGTEDVNALVTDDNAVVARLQPNGSLDTTFGNGGKALVDFGGYDDASSLALDPNGGIVIAGASAAEGEGFQSDFAVARLLGDPGAVKGRCAGKKATIIGTNAKDKLKGTKKRDVISAGKGKDTVKGKGGPDLICGGKGKDRLFGGKGKDRLFGQQGRDFLKGGPGKDKVKGGAGKDVQKP